MIKHWHNIEKEWLVVSVFFLPVSFLLIKFIILIWCVVICNETILCTTRKFSLALSWRRGPYHIETSPVICSANQWTGFYMIGTSVMKELKADWIIDKANCKIFQLNFASSFIIAMGYIFWPKIFLYTVAYFTVKRFIIFPFV